MTPNDLIASAIKRERKRVGLSLSALATQSGLAKSTMSQLEAGKGNPSIETLWAIAAALGVPFASLFEVNKPDTTLVRANEGMTLSADQSCFQTTLLANCLPGTRRDIYRADLEPEEERTSPAHPLGTIEHVIICAGQARIGPTEAVEVLNAGDYYRYPADRPHIYEALQSGTQIIVIMETRD